MSMQFTFIGCSDAKSAVISICAQTIHLAVKLHCH